ncbi:MAG: SDR family oxidoreductase [Bacteroidetes bacterium]|nr:SDR family oxidoreductase [Bacteroidota bacterium]
MKSQQKPVIWITGASKGIGAALAGTFSTLDAVVVLSGRNKSLLEKNVQAINNNGGSAFALLCDVTKKHDVDAAYKKISAKLGTVDTLINNAGVTTFKTFEETTAEDFNAIIETNLRGYFFCIKAVLPEMLKRKCGTIISIHSVSATNVFLRSSVYSAAKAGALAMTRCLRAEVRKSGIRVIDVLPGATVTEMWNEKVREKHHTKMMQPENLAEAVLSVYLQPEGVTTDEIVLRPIEGDL